MAKLILKYEDVVLKEYSVIQNVLTIGRREGNDIRIDNMAVSSAHAKIEKQGDEFVLTDLNSLNGVYVNKQKVSQKKLSHNDQILIGKHILLFQDESQAGKAPKSPEQPISTSGTVVLDSRKIQELLAQKPEKQDEAEAEEPDEAGRVAMLTIISGGESDQPREIDLFKKVTVLGRGEGCDVKIKGMFVSKTAAVISRRGTSYLISYAEGLAKTYVNSRPITSQRELKEGDQIEIGSTKLVFTFKD